MREISLLAEDLFTLQEGLYSLELLSFNIPETLVLTKREVFYFTTASVLDEWSKNMGHCWTEIDKGKAKVLWEKYIQMSLFSLQISQGQPSNWTRDSAVRSWQLIIGFYITNCCCCLARKSKYIPKLSTKFHGTVYKPPVRRGQSAYYYFLAITNVNKLMCKRWKSEQIYSHQLSESKRLSNDRYIYVCKYR
jgi:hypothetical protein